MVKQIFDNKIDQTKLLEIKIPVHFPTTQDMNEYEVVEGQIQLKNAFYNYVKLKITRDTMYFVCLPNTAKTHLVNANVITAKMINDVPVSKKGQESLAKRVNALNEYNYQVFQYQYIAFATPLKQINRFVTCSLNNPFIDSPGKPPTASC